MKKLLVLLLVGALLCAVAGCGKTPAEITTTAPNDTEEVTRETPDSGFGSPDEPEPESEPESEPATAPSTEAPTKPSDLAVDIYRPVIDWYAAVIKATHGDPQAEFLDTDTLPFRAAEANGDLNTHLDTTLREMAIAPSTCAYAYYDVNADGTSDLLLLTTGFDTSVKAIFTAVDGEPVLVDACWSR